MRPLQIADRYARAVFSLAEEQHLSERVFQELAAVCEAMNARVELLNLLKSPVITPLEKRSLVEGILGPQSTALSKQFLFLLVEKNRADLFPAIVEHLESIVNRERGIEEAVVTTARVLHPSVLQLLKKALEKITEKKIVLQTETKPELLGGVQVRMGNRLIDGTLKTKLERLESQLKRAKVY